ncbi:hypothetical protein D3C85_1198730 [compost metagenome]
MLRAGFALRPAQGPAPYLYGQSADASQQAAQFGRRVRGSAAQHGLVGIHQGITDRSGVRLGRQLPEQRANRGVPQRGSRGGKGYASQEQPQRQRQLRPARRQRHQPRARLDRLQKGRPDLIGGVLLQGGTLGEQRSLFVQRLFKRTEHPVGL